jgi:hypothetical protein
LSSVLDLVDDCPAGEYLTHVGAEGVRFVQRRHGSVEAALAQFAEWTGRRTRFTELAPRWAQFARAVAVQYESTQLIIKALETLHRGGVRSATIAEVVREACRINQPLAVEVFVTQDRRGEVLTADGALDECALQDVAVYKSGVHFQFKHLLRHVGLLTMGGTDDKDEVLSDEWQLERPVG